MARKYDKFIKQSEFEKPYREDEDYPAMQYYFPMPPGFEFPPFPEQAGVTEESMDYQSPLGVWWGEPEEISIEGGCAVNLYCDPNNFADIYPGESIIHCVSGFCSDNFEFEILGMHTDGFELSNPFYKYTYNTACVTLTSPADPDPDAKVYLQAVDLDYAYTDVTWPGTDTLIARGQAWKICIIEAGCSCETAETLEYD
ncbi:unnamed protein product, partial [marine sediment metagenome]